MKERKSRNTKLGGRQSIVEKICSNKMGVELSKWVVYVSLGGLLIGSTHKYLFSY